MPTADEWSLAIAEWATAGRRLGERIYLSVDDEALNRLGAEKWGIGNAFQEDFLPALRVQLRVLQKPNWTVTGLALPKGRSLKGGVPDCAAFLAFLVVCAARRGESLPDYPGNGTEFFFPWVRKFLGGLPMATRAGLGELDANPAPEPALWRRWARYLETCDYKSVIETTYQGPKANSGYALDQAILTFSCRRTLSRLARQERDALRRWTLRRDAGRLTEPPVPNATKHLKELLVERWDDEHVREAVLGALEGAPPGPRPSGHHLTAIRRGAGHYAVAVMAPAGWRKHVTCGGKPVVGAEVRLPTDLKLPEFVFQVNQASQRIEWKAPGFMRFLESADPLSPSLAGDPELGEEHYLLIPHGELGRLEQAQRRGECGWDKVVLWGSWVEFQAFRLNVPSIETSYGALNVRTHGGLIFQGGIRTGEPGRTPRVLSDHRGSVSAARGTGIVNVEELGIKFEVREDVPTPLPDLETGEYHLCYEGRKTTFEVVDWRNVVYEEQQEPNWHR